MFAYLKEGPEYGELGKVELPETVGSGRCQIEFVDRGETLAFVLKELRAH